MELTLLNHPHTKGGRFTRNMTGGIDEAVVGIITEAKYEDEEDGYKVRFTGEVYREELFSALESGLWLRAGYGVSIGGTGIPIATEEDEKGRMKMTFESDLTSTTWLSCINPLTKRLKLNQQKESSSKGLKHRQKPHH